MGTLTPNYSLNLPDIYGDVNVWGALLNANFTTIDTRLKIEEDRLNGIGRGGTGATTAAQARTNLDVQQANANLSQLAGLTLTNNKGVYGNGPGTLGLFDLTAFGRSLVDDADAITARATLGITAAIAQINALSSVAPLLSNWNQAENGTFFSALPGALNAPPETAAWYGFSLTHNNGSVVTIAIQQNGASIWMRTRTSGTWGAWARIYPHGLGAAGYRWSAPARVADTTYQNTTGYPIQVSVQLSGSDTSWIDVSVDGSTWIGMVQGDGDADLTASLVIPVGGYYRVRSGFNRWRELVYTP